MAYKKLWLNINGANRMVVFDLEKDTLADVLRPDFRRFSQNLVLRNQAAYSF